MAKQGKLLIVDDESQILEVLRELLEDKVAEIQTASSAKVAFNILTRHHFDAILCDINMPKMSGLELLKELRKRGSVCPFIVLTGHGDKAAAIEALRFGAMDFLDKPLNLENLVKAVEKAVELGIEFNQSRIGS